MSESIEGKLSAILLKLEAIERRLQGLPPVTPKVDGVEYFWHGELIVKNPRAALSATKVTDELNLKFYPNE